MDDYRLRGRGLQSELTRMEEPEHPDADILCAGGLSRKQHDASHLSLDDICGHSSIRRNMRPAVSAALAPGTPCTRTISNSSGCSAGTSATTKPSPGA